MTPAKRIALNVAVTYGRSLVALVAGLFSGRWLLLALGEGDYGILGLVGGLSVFVAFVNYTLAAANERFLGVAIGAGDVDAARRWFSLTLALHAVLAFVLAGLAYPLGVWFIRKVFVLPPDRVDAAVKVLGFVAVECFVGLATVPFNSLYVARQRLAELTAFGLVQTLVNVAVLGYFVTHPGTWLVTYALVLCAIRVVPALILALIATFVFPECRFRLGDALDKARIRAFCGFVAGRSLGLVGQLFADNGLAIVVNRRLGVARNAAVTVGTTVSYNVASLSGALSRAFMPAILNAAGARDFVRMRRYALRSCVFSTLAILVFAVPLALEAGEVLRLWLSSPPAGAATLTVCLLAVAVFEKLTEGQWIAIAAVGDIRSSQTCEALALFGAFALGWALVAAGLDVLGMGLALLAGKAVVAGIRVVYGQRVAGIARREWCGSVLLPMAAVTAVTVALASVPRLLLPASFARVAVTTLVSLAAFAPLAWIFALSAEDRAGIRRRFRRRMPPAAATIEDGGRS